MLQPKQEGRRHVTGLRQAPVGHSDPLIGALLDARYQVHGPIGKGGMGTVYLAEHVLLRRKVAIKTLHPALTSTPEVIERFHREAVAAGSIGSEHIVRVTDMGRFEGDICYIVMEYLEGADVGWRVSTEGSLSVLRTRHIALQLCKALGAVHAAGIVHRDLKPENLFLTTRDGDSDFLKILDFGICKFRDLAAHSYSRLTATAVALGTPHFMAPEQIEGSKLLDHRADLYAVGANLYFMLTGTVPFDAGSVPGLFHRICLEPAPDVRGRRPDVPAALAEVLDRALAKSPDARFASAGEFYDALAALSLPEESAATRKARLLDSSIRRSAERGSTVPSPTAPSDDASARAVHFTSRLHVESAIAIAGRPTRAQRALRLALAAAGLLMIIALYAILDTVFAGAGQSQVGASAAQLQRSSAADATVSSPRAEGASTSPVEPPVARPASATLAPARQALRDGGGHRSRPRTAPSAQSTPTPLQLPAAESRDTSTAVVQPVLEPSVTHSAPELPAARPSAYQPSERSIIEVFDP
jgi:serine/threonine protein kinase